MAQATYTPIQLYFSTTAAAIPTSGNLANGELAINIQDEKLYFKNAAGTVKLLASNATSALTASATIPNTDISGLGTMSTQNASSVTITGGTVNGTVIGGTTAAAGSFTTVTATGGISRGTF